MTAPLNFTKPPQPCDAKTRLRPVILRGREREISHERRPVPPIEAVSTLRLDLDAPTARPLHMKISLPRVKFLERK